MFSCTSDTAAELKLLATILERLLDSSPAGGARPDQLRPLSTRLRKAVDSISPSPASPPGRPSVAKSTGAGGTPIPSRGKAADSPTGLPAATSLLEHAASQQAAKPAAGSAFRQVKASTRNRPPIERAPVVAMTKASSVRARAVPREIPPTNALLVSKDVVRVFTCTLYNVLESLTRMLEASTASIFVKDCNEMISVVNVSPKLSFPPKLKRYRCQDTPDTEVLGSGIALNQQIHDPSADSTSVLTFPVYASGSVRTGRCHAIATIHVENKVGGKKFFDAFDESLLFFGAGVIGEIMSRAPVDWMEEFYDPATQHIIAPFEPCRISGLPLLRPEVSGRTEDYIDKSKRDELAARIDSFAEDILIKRESLPNGPGKSTVGGLSVIPSLREVRNYVENVQDCWRRNASSNVNLMEAEREGQMELKGLRRDLTRAQKQLADRDEELRLYQLEGSDYKQEYKDIKKELDAYIHKRDKTLM